MLDRKNSPASIPQLEKRIKALEKSEGGVTKEDIASFIAEMLSKYDEALKKKQDVLQAGENITIEDNVISATAGEIVVDSGTDGVWTYKKLSSGDCEIYGQLTKTLALTTSSGNTYSTSGNQTELLPFPLVSGIAVGNAVDKFTEAVTCHVEGQNLIWRPFRHASSSSASRTYAFIVKGRWK